MSDQDLLYIILTNRLSKLFRKFISHPCLVFYCGSLGKNEAPLKLIDNKFIVPNDIDLIVFSFLPLKQSRINLIKQSINLEICSAHIDIVSWHMLKPFFLPNSQFMFDIQACIHNVIVKNKSLLMLMRLRLLFIHRIPLTDLNRMYKTRLWAASFLLLYVTNNLSQYLNLFDRVFVFSQFRKLFLSQIDLLLICNNLYVSNQLDKVRIYKSCLSGSMPQGLEQYLDVLLNPSDYSRFQPTNQDIATVLLSFFSFHQHNTPGLDNCCYSADSVYSLPSLDSRFFGYREFYMNNLLSLYAHSQISNTIFAPSQELYSSVKSIIIEYLLKS